MEVMAFIFFVVLLMASYFGEMESVEVDCSLRPMSSMTMCSVTGDYAFNYYYYSNSIYCDHPYTCCEDGNGCCFDGNSSTIFTIPELLALILNGTALFVVGILSLVICGATFCNSKEDESHIFLRNGTRK
ncbi:hypothetical protein ACF0H5_020837 [Mactra antiquata]